MMRSQFLNENRSDDLCSCCGKFSHNIANCPLIHFTVQKEVICAKLFASCSQERDSVFIRRKFRSDEKFHTMSLNHTVKYELKRARLNFAKERHSFLNDYDVQQTFQFHTKDKQFFQSVPQIILIQNYEDNNLYSFDTTRRISNKLTGASPFDHQLSVNRLSSESQTDSDFSNSNDSSLQNCRSKTELSDKQLQNNQPVSTNEPILNYSISENLEGECENINEEDIQDENDSENKKEPSNQQYVKGLYIQNQRQNQNLYSLSNTSSSNINQSSTHNTYLNTSSLMHNIINCPEIQTSKKNKKSQLIMETDLQRYQLQQKKSEKDRSQNRKVSLMISMNSSSKQLVSIEDQKKVKQIQGRSSQMFYPLEPRNLNKSIIPNQSDHQHQDKEQRKSQHLKLHRQSSRMILSTTGEEKRDALKSMRKQNSKTILSNRNIEEAGIDPSFMKASKSTSKNKFNSSEVSYQKHLSLDHQRQNTKLQSVVDQLKQGDSLKKNNIKSEFVYDLDTKEDNDLFHIFGELKFTFDKVKEYLIFYPQFNFTNVVRRIRRKYIANNIPKISTTKKKLKI